MSTLTRSISAPLRRRRYSSVLESALVSIGREDAVVRSTRKARQKWCLDASESPIRGLRNVFSAPEQQSFDQHLEKNEKKKEEEEEEKDPFAHLIVLKAQKKKKKEKNEKKKKNEKDATCSPAVTRSATKEKKSRSKRHFVGVLEMVGRTRVTRSMVKEKKKWKRSRLERIDDMDEEEEGGEEEGEEDGVVIQKKLFQSPQKKKGVENVAPKTRRGSRKVVVLKHWCLEWPPRLEKKKQSEVEKALLVLAGRVDGERKQFAVGKREGVTRFTSKNGVYVTLSGKLDRKAARRARIPRAVMEMMDTGIPAYFHKRFLPYAQKSRDNGKHDKTGSSPRAGKKKASGADKYCSPLPLIHHEIEAMTISKSIQDEVYSTPKPKKTRALARTKQKRTSAKKEEPEPEAEREIWTTEQQEALIDAKLKIPTTAPNFWAQVAQHVPGKSARDCQAKTFEQFRSPPTTRKFARKPLKRASTEPHPAVPTKIARAGSNKFKKQVREFVEEYEKKHVDDLFQTTPSKEGLPELPEFDSIKSPELGTPSRSCDDNDSEMDDEAPGQLKKLSSRRRDDIDSYVLGINRQHVAYGGVMAGGKVRRVTSMVTPAKAATAMSAKKKAVILVEEIGSHSLKGVVSPGGTTHVCIEKDGSSSEGDEEDDSSEENEDFDLP